MILVVKQNRIVSTDLGIDGSSCTNRITTSGYFSANGTPVLEVNLVSALYNQIARVDDLDVNDMQLSGSSFGSFNNRMDVQQFQFDGEYYFEQGIV